MIEKNEKNLNNYGIVQNQNNNIQQQQINQNQYQYNQIPNNNQNIYYPVQQINYPNQQPVVIQQPVYIQQPNQIMIPQFPGIQYVFVQDPLIELANSIGAKIHQQIEMVEILTGFEIPNRYHVLVKDFNGQYKYLFKCKEDSTCCQRQCCPTSQREFNMRIKHIANMNMFAQNFENIFAMVNKPYNCPFCCLGRPYMECNYSNGIKFGKIYQPFYFCNPEFYIYDGNDSLKYSINCDCCQCGFVCKNNFCGKLSECLFEISDGNGRIDGYIKRLPSRGLQIISDSDSYDVRFPTNASPSEKFLIILAAILIDYQYFEFSAGEPGQQGVGYYRYRY